MYNISTDCRDPDDWLNYFVENETDCAPGLRERRPEWTRCGLNTTASCAYECCLRARCIYWGADKPLGLTSDCETRDERNAKNLEGALVVVLVMSCVLLCCFCGLVYITLQPKGEAPRPVNRRAVAPARNNREGRIVPLPRRLPQPANAAREQALARFRQAAKRVIWATNKRKYHLARGERRIFDAARIDDAANKQGQQGFDMLRVAQTAQDLQVALTTIYDAVLQITDHGGGSLLAEAWCNQIALHELATERKNAVGKQHWAPEVARTYGQILKLLRSAKDEAASAAEEAETPR